MATQSAGRLIVKSSFVRIVLRQVHRVASAGNTERHENDRDGLSHGGHAGDSAAALASRRGGRLQPGPHPLGVLPSSEIVSFPSGCFTVTLAFLMLGLLTDARYASSGITKVRNRLLLTKNILPSIRYRRA